MGNFLYFAGGGDFGSRGGIVANRPLFKMSSGLFFPILFFLKKMKEKNEEGKRRI